MKCKYNIANCENENNKLKCKKCSDTALAPSLYKQSERPSPKEIFKYIDFACCLYKKNFIKLSRKTRKRIADEGKKWYLVNRKRWTLYERLIIEKKYNWLSPEYKKYQKNYLCTLFKKEFMELSKRQQNRMQNDCEKWNSIWEDIKKNII